MKKMFWCLPIAVVLAVSCRMTADGLDEDLRRLDDTLEKMDEYVHAKEQRIGLIEDILAADEMSLLQQYHVYGQLYDEYVAYQFDRAREVLEIQERLAEEMRNRSLKNDVVLKKTVLFTTAGMYLEAENLFAQLDTAEFDNLQMISWLNARQKFLHDYQEYLSTSGIVVADAVRIREYQNRILDGTPSTSMLNAHIRVLQMIEDERYEEAYEENGRIIEALNRDTRDYAVQTYWQGYICEHMDRMEEAVGWWVKSACCDVSEAIKDNASLCSIALKLIDHENTERAFRYIRTSLDDAIFYNAKLRKVQIASTLPLVENAYVEIKDSQSRDRNRYLVLVSLLALLLMATSIQIFRMYRKRRAASEELRERNRRLAEYADSIEAVENDLVLANIQLVEANTAKEEYLGLYLSMCSGYLDKLKKTISREQYETELKTFYKTFDTSFLQLYPNFVEDFNALLKEDGRIVLKEGEMLNTELRVFALIRLGITQSSHIASLLRYSVNTIYNYRAQIKNAALSDRENFEEAVRKIGSRKS